MIACMGLTGFIAPASLPAIVAPIGASSVLVFAVPASPLAKPWAVIMGNVLSATVGVLVSLLLLPQILAAGLAVGLAILLMSTTRSSIRPAARPPSRRFCCTPPLPDLRRLSCFRWCRWG